MRAGKHLIGGADLHQSAQIEHGDAVRQVAHYPEIVRNEDVADRLVAGLSIAIIAMVSDRIMRASVAKRADASH